MAMDEWAVIGTSRFISFSVEGKVRCSFRKIGNAICITVVSFKADFTVDPNCLCLAAADILLWKDRNLSAGVLAGATLIWYLFEVVEYNIIPLVCQIAALAMLVIFIWSNAAPLLNMYDFPFLMRKLRA